MKKKIGFAVVIACIVLVSVAQARRGRPSAFVFATNPLTAYSTQF